MLDTARLRRALLLMFGCAALTGAPRALAADDATPRYAVLSAIGDQLTLVFFQRGVGSNIDQNVRKEVPIKDTALDNFALLAVDDAIRQRHPKAATALMSSRDAALLKPREQLLDSPAEAAQLLEPVKDVLQKTQATRLILVSKARADARFAMREGYVGTGKVNGLGFYIDQEMRVQLVESGKRDIGFIAPYAYLSVSLIDVPTLSVIRRKLVTESTVVATAEASGALRPWDAMTSQQKIDAIERLIRTAIERALPELLNAE